MAQNAVVNQIGTGPATQTDPKSPIAIDSYADRLMDELFEEVDQALDSSTGLPTDPVQPDVISLKPITVPQIVLPPTMLPRQDDSRDDAEIARQIALAVAKKQDSRQSFDRILLGAAFASLLLTLGLWFISRSGWGQRQTASLAPSDTEATTTAKIQAETQFADYLRQSLDTIEQKRAAAPQPGILPAPNPTNLPSIPVPGTPPVTGGLAQAINRVADAIEQASTQPNTVPAPQVVIMPPAPAARTSVPNTPSAAATAPTPPQTQPSPATPQPPAATAVPLAPKILAREPEAAAPAERPVEPEATAPESETAALPSEAPIISHTLVGILELGDKSAALFEIEGVARRIYVGESIGASGWTLAEVKNQEAVIRRGGEVRSIFVGQKF